MLIDALNSATLRNPFETLGLQQDADGKWRMRAWMPGAKSVKALP